jgi:lysyl-tRNA synthetase class 2
MRESIIDDRKKKCDALKEANIDLYPSKSKRTHTIAEALDDFGSFSKSKKVIFLTGRLGAMRDMGNVIFAELRDISGPLQIVMLKGITKDYPLWKKGLDSGDFIEVSGFLFTTKRGEKSLEVKKVKILSKSLRPLPTEFYGIADIETKLRKRYLDLVMNAELRDMFMRKSIFWSTFRDSLNAEGFLEVETPVMELVPGGAEAEPFVTHHNALDTDYFLRISLEIALKKLMVGGFERIFEIGRIFRNEGIDASHLQDYTQLEFYWAYSDYDQLMKYIEKLYKKVVKETCGASITQWDGHKINWGKKWGVVDYYKVMKKEYGFDLETVTVAELQAKAKERNVKFDKSDGKGRLIDLLFKQIRHTLIQPCFLINPPADIEPLAKRIPGTNRVARFQVVACGTELGKGFSEANDPIDQRERFEEQMKLREQGDAEAQRIDEDFIEAMEYGMPPMAGFGVSERLFAVLMNKPVRETVFFPMMRRSQ